MSIIGTGKCNPCSVPHASDWRAISTAIPIHDQDWIWIDIIQKSHALPAQTLFFPTIACVSSGVSGSSMGPLEAAHKTTTMP
eukprot:scaffold139620_cov10-Tisochrysis_lutea.AAC.1